MLHSCVSFFVHLSNKISKSPCYKSNSKTSKSYSSRLWSLVLIQLKWLGKSLILFIVDFPSAVERGNDIRVVAGPYIVQINWSRVWSWAKFFPLFLPTDRILGVAYLSTNLRIVATQSGCFPVLLFLYNFKTRFSSPLVTSQTPKHPSRIALGYDPSSITTEMVRGITYFVYSRLSFSCRTWGWQPE